MEVLFFGLMTEAAVPTSSQLKHRVGHLGTGSDKPPSHPRVYPIPHLSAIPVSPNVSTRQGDIHAADSVGRTPMSIASGYGNKACVSALISVRACLHACLHACPRTRLRTCLRTVVTCCTSQKRVEHVYRHVYHVRVDTYIVDLHVWLWPIQLWSIHLWPVHLWPVQLWPIQLWPNTVMAYTVMAYTVMA